MKKQEQPPSKVTNTYLTKCPECGYWGTILQEAPVRVRRCKNGHVWDDPKHYKQVYKYVPLSQRLAEAGKALKTVLEVLHEAETMIRDLADELPAKTRNKYGVQSTLYRIEQVQEQHQGDDQT